MKPRRASDAPFDVRLARARALFEAHRVRCVTLSPAACSCDLCLLAVAVLVEAKARAAIPIWTDVPRSQRVAAIAQGMRDSQEALGYRDATLERAVRLMVALAPPRPPTRLRPIQLSRKDPPR